MGDARVASTAGWCPDPAVAGVGVKPRTQSRSLACCLEPHQCCFLGSNLRARAESQTQHLGVWTSGILTPGLNVGSLCGHLQN